MSRHVPKFLFLIVILHLNHSSIGYSADVDDFIDFSMDDLPGRLYVPPEAETHASGRPVILFLHGAGETGTDNRNQINGNIDNLLAAAQERGTFLYAPQATTRVGSISNWNDEQRTDSVMAMVDRILDEQNADGNRIYITGLSMGGGGAWNMASRAPDRFAAAVPIAGVRTAADFDPTSMAATPTWAFHARNDNVVPARNRQNVVNSILESAGEPMIAEFPSRRDRETTIEFSNDLLDLNYTEYPLGGHGIWGRVYDTPEMYDWMFSHAIPEPSSASLLIVGFLFLASKFRHRR